MNYKYNFTSHCANVLVLLFSLREMDFIYLNWATWQHFLTLKCLSPECKNNLSLDFLFSFSLSLLFQRPDVVGILVIFTECARLKSLETQKYQKDLRIYTFWHNTEKLKLVENSFRCVKHSCKQLDVLCVEEQDVVDLILRIKYYDATRIKRFGITLYFLAIRPQKMVQVLKSGTTWMTIYCTTQITS